MARRRSAGTARTSRCPTRAALEWVVRFESVNYRARVWLNGTPIGANTRRLPAVRVPPRRASSAPASTGSSCASTTAAARPTSRPRASTTNGGRPAAGGTTAGSCARSTSRRVDRSTSSTVVVRPELPCARCDATVRLRTTRAQRRVARASASGSTGDFGGRDVDARHARVGAARLRAFAGALTVKQPAAVGAAPPNLYTRALTPRAGGRTRRALPAEHRHPQDPRSSAAGCTQRPAA